MFGGARLPIVAGAGARLPIIAAAGAFVPVIAVVTECRDYQVIPAQNGALLRADPASTVASPVCA